MRTLFAAALLTSAITSVIGQDHPYSCGEAGMTTCAAGGMQTKRLLTTTYGPLTASGISITPVYSVKWWETFDNACSAFLGGTRYTGSNCTNLIIKDVTWRATTGVYTNQNTVVNVFHVLDEALWQYFEVNRGQGPSNARTENQGYWINGESCGPWRGSFLTGSERMGFNNGRGGFRAVCKNARGADNLSQSNFNGLIGQITDLMRRDVASSARFAIYRKDKSVIARCRIALGDSWNDTCPDPIYGSDSPYEPTGSDTTCNPCQYNSP
ncbi:hypothetical protein BDZ85DRAFT_280511 [Elsinoe ampelina]|uniref:Uncharacterized protein n=1 Tax=Elsinoe ampelina TaxID=302913 RepID=A0A6A6GHY3_9PEZI|nr:hypothetical protein BDZ85DRAFT_280511 [Elsinoe ampelina]